MYNCKLDKYHDTIEKAKAIAQISSYMKNNGLVYTDAEVTQKMQSLRNYFGAEKRKESSSKTSGAGRNQVYTSAWLFMDAFSFLVTT